jgi:hypothetical protein
MDLNSFEKIILWATRQPGTFAKSSAKVKKIKLISDFFLKST